MIVDEEDQWAATIGAGFPSRTLVTVTDDCSPFYLRGGFVRGILPDAHKILVCIESERENVGFRAEQLRVCRRADADIERSH